MELSLPGLKLSSGIEHPAPRVVDRDELARLVVEAAALAREGGHGGLLLIIDEFQEAPEPDLVVLVNTIQDTAGQNGSVAVVAAGLPQTPDALMSAGSFAERFTYLSIGRLTDDEAVLALLEPARQRDVEWSPGAAAAVLRKANGSPYLLQLFADSTWEAAGPERGGLITPTAATTGIAAADAQLRDGMFRGRWNKAAPTERELLVAVAATLTDEGTAATRDIAAAIGRTAQQFSGARQRLIDKGLLEPAGHGRLAFTMPGFEEFVRVEVGVAYRADIAAPIDPHAALLRQPAAIEDGASSPSLLGDADAEHDASFDLRGNRDDEIE